MRFSLKTPPTLIIVLITHNFFLFIFPMSKKVNLEPQLSTAETDKEESFEIEEPFINEKFYIKSVSKANVKITTDDHFFVKKVRTLNINRINRPPNLNLLKIIKVIKIYNNQLKDLSDFKLQLSMPMVDFNSLELIKILIKYIDFLNYSRFCSEFIVKLYKNKKFSKIEFNYLNLLIMNSFLFPFYDIKQQFIMHFYGKLKDTKYKYIKNIDLQKFHINILKLQSIIYEKTFTELNFIKNEAKFWTVRNIEIIPYYIISSIIDVLLVIFEVRNLDNIICNAPVIDCIIEFLGGISKQIKGGELEILRYRFKLQTFELVKYCFNNDGSYDLLKFRDLFIEYVVIAFEFANELKIN